jgi:hypothetical protein
VFCQAISFVTRARISYPWVPGAILYALGISGCLPLGSLVVVMVEEWTAGADNSLISHPKHVISYLKIGSRSTSTQERALYELGRTGTNRQEIASNRIRKRTKDHKTRLEIAIETSTSTRNRAANKDTRRCSRLSRTCK